MKIKKPLLPPIDAATVEKLWRELQEPHQAEAALDAMSEAQPELYKVMMGQVAGGYVGAQFMVGVTFTWWLLEEQFRIYKRSLQ